MTTLTLLSNGESIGEFTVDADLDRVRIRYLVDHNGRGAKLEEEIHFDEAGAPSAWRIDGTSLMGGAVSERYERDTDGTTRWTSQADTGERAPSADDAVTAGCYLPADGSPYALHLIIERAHRDGATSVALLPGGTATVEPEPIDLLEDGSVLATMVTGVALHPQYVLYDRSGVLVGVLSDELSGLALVASLLEHAERINELLMERTRNRLATIAAQAQVDVPGRLVIRDVRIFDGVSVHEDRTCIVVDDGRISTIGEDPGDGSVVIDGAGRIVVPGWHDMHAHLTAASALLYTAAGVTGVRDMGNDNVALAHLMDAIAAGEVVGPSAVRAGFIEGRSPYSEKLGIVVDTLDEAISAVDWYADRGFHAIKIYNSFTPEWVEPTAARAHAHGMRVQGHIPAFTDADAMIEAGYDEITHINQLVLGWVLDAGEDTRTPLRLTALRRTAGLDLDSEPVQRTIAAMATRGIGLDTTMVILEQLMLSRARATLPAHEPIIDHMPAAYRRSSRRTYVPFGSQAELDSYQESFETMLALIGRLHERGVPLWPGTDDSTGLSLHRELELFVEAGLEPAEVLTIASHGCAAHLHRGHERGRIEAGYIADLVLLDADPLAAIRNVRQVALTVTEGRVIIPATIYRGFGIEPFASTPAITVTEPSTQ